MKILSVDLNPFAQRATLLDQDGVLLEHFSARPRESVSGWLGRVIARCGSVTVVGSPLDDWPDGAADLVLVAGARMQWLNPSLIRRLFTTCRPWNLHRKMHRARFLGHLHLANAGMWDAESATREFEIKAARELLSQLGVEFEAIGR